MDEILVTQYALANPLDLLVCLEVLGYLGIDKYKITKKCWNNLGKWEK